MSPTLQLSQRDRAIVEALALRVRLLSQRQIADHWFAAETVNARRRLQQLAQVGLLERITVPARPLPELLSPLVTWRPDEASPDFGHLAYQAQRRWRNQPLRPVAAWIASEYAAHLTGGEKRGRLPHTAQATHDLGVAAIWLRVQQLDPLRAANWRGEDLMACTRLGQKLPDAFLVDEQEQVAWVVEFIGSYDTARLAAFHADCATRQLAYQGW